MNWSGKNWIACYVICDAAYAATEHGYAHTVIQNMQCHKPNSMNGKKGYMIHF